MNNGVNNGNVSKQSDKVVSPYNNNRGKRKIKKDISDTTNDYRYQKRNKMKVQTRIINQVERKKSLAEKFEERFGVEVNITWMSVLRVSIITVIVICGLVFGIYTTRITEVEVENSGHYTEDEIKNFVMDSILEKNSIFLYLKYRYSDQKSIPFVEYLDVDLVNKNKIKITVYDKNIIGCTKYMSEYIYFDKDGNFVESSQEIMDGTPYITGINFNNITLYDQMSVDNSDLFDTIIGLTQQIKKYNIMINEINFDKEYNVTLMTDNITILLGVKDVYDEQLAQLPNILAQAEKKKMKGTLHLENYKEGIKNFNFDAKL